MINRILYWFITLPVFAKAGCLTTLVLVFACTFTTIASIPATRARMATEATQTTVAIQAQSTQVAVKATETSVANTASTAQAYQNATATSAAAFQIATQTSAAIAQIATQTSVAAPTVTAQAYIDATNAAIQAATATSQASIDATSTTVAQATVAAAQTAEAVAAEKATAQAVPTQTAIAKAAATATVQAIETTYQEIDVRALKKNPDKYTGVPLKLKGQVFRIEEENNKTAIQMWVQVPGGNEFDREAVAVVFDGTLESVFEDSYIIVYGIGAGKIEGTNAFGAQIVQPLVKGEYIRF